MAEPRKYAHSSFSSLMHSLLLLQFLSILDSHEFKPCIKQ